MNVFKSVKSFICSLVLAGVYLLHIFSTLLAFPFVLAYSTDFGQIRSVDPQRVLLFAVTYVLQLSCLGIFAHLLLKEKRTHSFKSSQFHDVSAPPPVSLKQNPEKYFIFFKK